MQYGAYPEQTAPDRARACAPDRTHRVDWYPAEIENVLASHDGITEVAVIGMPSARWGESPLAVVVRSDETLGAEDVLAFCKGKLAPFKQPKHVEFIDVIPRNPTGKVLKRTLRERFPGAAEV